MMTRRATFSGLEVALIALLIAGVTVLVATRHYQGKIDRLSFFVDAANAELDPYRAKYGPGRYSENVEEWLIRDFFQDKRDGVFLDVGAGHYIRRSNTYYLEHMLGWSGIAVDALTEWAADYAEHRPHTRYVALFASDEADRTVQLFVPETAEKTVASSSYDFTAKTGMPGTARSVPTTTLNAVLEQAGVPRIDFLSMDIELAEPKALAGFDIDAYRPALVCIEAHREVRQQIFDYFLAHRYVVVGKYLRADPNNLYFAPAQ